MRSPRPHPFLSAEHGDADPAADALLFGVASGGGVSFRGGAEDGPEGIRRFSDSLETYSPRAGRDLAELHVVDLGDWTGEPAGAGRLADGVLGEAWSSRRRPLLACLGGDHSVTPPIVAAVARHTERLSVIGLDAHLDLRSEYPGEHACTFRRVVELGIPSVVLGARSGGREEWDTAPRLLAHYDGELFLPAGVREALEDTDVYLTIDVDVLDPGVAPGTGNPEPGGPGFDELLGAVEALEGLRIVGFDVVEVAPVLDPSGVTQAAAAKLVREMLVRFVDA